MKTTRRHDPPGTPGTPGADRITELVDRHQRPLMSYALWMLRDGDRAADAVAETFARLCREDLAALDSKLPQWLFTVCRNLAIDTIRRDKRMSPLTDNLEQTLETSSSGGGGYSGGDPSHQVEQTDTHAAALRAIDALPGNQQEVVRLKFQHEMSYKQIAAVTGLTVTNVGYLLHVALKALRQRLENKGGAS